MRLSINNIFKGLLLVAIPLLSVDLTAQCSLRIYPDEDTLNIACGTQVVISRDSLSGVALQSDFDNGVVDNGWSQDASAMLNNPCGAKSSTYLWMGDLADVPRELTTTPLDLSCGGEVCFQFRMAIQGEASPCEGPDLPNEGVLLEYSVAGGPWDSIFYFEPDDNGSFNAAFPGAGDYTAWADYCFTLPPGAMFPDVELRWAQQASSTAPFDHWGLDSVVITSNCLSVFTMWDNGIPGDTSNSFLTPDIIDTTIYTLIRASLNTLTLQSDTCLDSIVIIPRLPSVPVNPAFDPFCKGTDAEINVNFNNGQFLDPSVVYLYEWLDGVFDSTSINYAVKRNFVSDTVFTYRLEHPDHPVCTVTDTVEIFAGGVELEASTFVDNPTCFRDTLADLYLYWEGELSQPLLTLSRDGQFIAPPPIDTLLTNFKEGDYQLIIRDERCFDTLEFTVTVPDTVDITLTNIDTNICVESTTPQSFVALNGAEPYMYYFDSLLVDTFELRSDQDTTFGLYAIDAFGCTTDTIRKTFIVPPPIKIEQFDTLVCPNIPFQVTAVASGGLGGPYNYAWHNGDLTATTTLTGSIGSTYSVVVTDGCALRGIMQPGINIIPTPEHVIVREYVGEDPFTGDTALITVANNAIEVEYIAPLAMSFKPDPKLPGSTYTWDLWFNGSVSDRQYGWPVIPPDSAVDVGFRYAKDDRYEVRLITTTAEGCVDTAFATHLLKFQGVAPNVITPNGEMIIMVTASMTSSTYQVQKH